MSMTMIFGSLVGVGLIAAFVVNFRVVSRGILHWANRGETSEPMYPSGYEGEAWNGPPK